MRLLQLIRTIVSSLEGASNFLSVVAKRSPGAKGVQAAERLSNALANLAKASPEARARAADALVRPLKMTLGDIRLGLNPEKITLDSLPPGLVAGWKGRRRPRAGLGSPERRCGTTTRFCAISWKP